MDVLVYIALLWYTLSTFFKIIGDYAESLPFVGSNLRYWFHFVGNWFYDGVGDSPPSLYCLYSRTMEFNTWVQQTIARLKQILTLEDIYNSLLVYLNAAIDAWAWVLYAVSNITSVIITWWQTAQGSVQGWIEAAKQWSKALIDQVSVALATLRQVWDEFALSIPSINAVLDWFRYWWSNVLVNLDSWWRERLWDIQELINSTIADWLPFYNELVELWGGIQEFFVDPLQWCYNKLDDFFDRFW